MTDLDAAERKALFILFTQSQIDSGLYGTPVQLNSEYDSRIPSHLLASAFQKWVIEDLAKTDRSVSVPRFRLRRDKFAEAYRRVLELFNASSITIYPDTSEIVSNIDPTSDFPIKEGWKWLTYESDEEPEQGAIYGHVQHAIHAPPISRWAFSTREIDWTKWGTLLAAVIGAATIAIMKGWL